MNIYVRPWGYFVVLEDSSTIKVKKIVVAPRSKLSLQKHLHRSESWYLASGEGYAVINDNLIKLYKEHVVIIPKNTQHRLINNSDKQLVIIEIWCGDNLSESDIERLEDDYGRV